MFSGGVRSGSIPPLPLSPTVEGESAAPTAAPAATASAGLVSPQSFVVAEPRWGGAAVGCEVLTWGRWVGRRRHRFLRAISKGVGGGRRATGVDMYLLQLVGCLNVSCLSTSGSHSRRKGPLHFTGLASVFSSSPLLSPSARPLLVLCSCRCLVTQWLVFEAQAASEGGGVEATAGRGSCSQGG